MANFNLKKGHNLKLVGHPSDELNSISTPDHILIQPNDFAGIKPKLLVKAGDTVSIGTALFYDKLNEKVKFVSPVNGKINDIEFGERRVINKIIIGVDSVEQTTSAIEVDSTDEIIEKLLESGLWPSLRARPFSKIANPENLPRDIFISAYNTSPFAPNLALILKDNEESFQKGLEVLSKLTSGKLHLSISADETNSTLLNAKNVQLHKFTGPHPAGNVGVQIHHISPIKNRDDVVWYLDPQNVVEIGKYFNTGEYSTHKIISVGGASAIKPAHYKVLKGTSIKNILDSTTDGTNVRIISGDVLSGVTRTINDSLGFYHHQITQIPEESQREFLGWAMPGIKKYTLSRTFLSSLFPQKNANLSTTMNGSHRAIISFGRWEKVLPMDILPEFLIKSILARDIEEMEKLGIYECDPEDFALCSFVCQSKTDVSKIISDGLQFAEQEG